MRLLRSMKIKRKRLIWRVVLALVVAYIGGGILLYLVQDLLLFHPTPLPKDHKFSFDQPFEEENIQVRDNNLSIVKFTSFNRKGLVLFFHGNMENVEHYRSYPAYFTKNGYEVWMIDYPGFGKSTGKRTEQILYDDALLFYNKAIEQIKSDSIIIYGKSIGTGIAVHLASVAFCKKLILETPYYSIDALAKHFFSWYPVTPMTKYSIPTYEYLKKVQSPITIFHGTDDEVIPYEQAKWLKEENPGIELITIEKGKHNNLAQSGLFKKKLDSLLSN